MSTATTELSIFVRLKDEATAEMQKMSKSFSKSFGAAEEASKTFAKGLLAGGTALAGLGAISLNAASNAEQAQTAFTTMLGSAEKAQSFIAEMKKFAAATPFETSDISQAAQTMLSFGISSESVMGNIKMLGDVALGNKEKFKSLSLVFSQVQSSGKLMGGDLLQMVGQGFNPLQIISQKTGESMASLKEKMEKGAISADMVTDAFKSATSQGGLFYGGMEAQSKTFAGTMSTLKDNMTAQAQVIGEQLLPYAKQFVDVASNFVQNTLPIWIQKTGEIVNWFLQHKEAIWVVAGAIMGGLVPSLLAMAGAFLANAIILAPFIIGGAIIAGLVAGILWIKDNWDMISAKATEIWNGIASYLEGIYQKIQEATSKVFDGIKSYFDGVWKGISDTFNFWTSLIVGAVIVIFNAFGIDIVGVLTGISTSISTTLSEWNDTFAWACGLISTAWNTFWNGVSQKTQTTKDTISGIIGGLFTWIQTSFKTISEPLGALWKGMWEGMGNVVTGIWEGVKSTIKSSINWIIDQINKVISSINGVAAKGASVLGIGSISMGTIPRLAEGGIVTRPTLALIGEAGPEAIVPLSRGRSAGAGTVVNVYVTGNQFMNKREFEKMMDEIVIKRMGLVA